MPCFSASNIRFITAQQNAPQYGIKKDRAKTAMRNNGGSETSFQPSYGPNLKPEKNKCDDLLSVKGYVAQDQNVKPSQRNKIKKNAPKIQQTMIPQKDWQRLQASSKIVTLEDRLDALVKQEQATKRFEEEAVNTRQRFKQIDEARKRALEAKVEKEDLFGAGEKLKVLERAFLAKHEEEEEVKRVNRIILNAKCHAVRDAQIQEKSELDKDLKNEQTRLDKMVLDRAIQSLNEEDKKFEKQKDDKLKYAQEIRNQLNERENLRFLEAERIEQEAIMIQKASEAVKREDERQLQLAHERRLKFREELRRISDMSLLFKKMLCEQERQAEMRVAAYMREKEARQRALMVEKQLAKDAFERKQQRLYTLAQKMNESKSQREEMAYIREQERIERNYRHREKELALRKRQLEKEIVEARKKQMLETKHRQALQIARAEQDFNNLVERLKQEEEKQKRIDDERKQRRKCYRSDIIRQMSDKELERRRLIEMNKEQASAWRETERQRDTNIRTVINAKLSSMREACLPEKYIKEVEQQMHKIAKTSNSLKH